MPVSTRPPARRHTISYRPRKGSGRRRPRRRPAAVPPWLAARPGLVWAALAAVVALAAAMPFLASPLVGAFQGLLGRFGLGLALVAGGVALDLRLALRRRADYPPAFWRLWAGAHLLLVFALGVMGFFRPGWRVGDVSFQHVSAGGEVGRFLAANVFGLLLWVSAGLGGVAVIWPRGVRLAGRGAVAFLRAVAALRIPQRAAEAVRACAAALLPGTEEGEELPPRAGRLYVPRWDEDWDAPPAAEEGAEVAPAVEAPAAEEEAPAAEGEEGKEGEEEPVLVTSEPEERPEAYQRPLPMGRPAGHGWELPPLDILEESVEGVGQPVDNEARAQLIVDTLASFGVNARVVSISQGPTVTQFGVEPGWETKTRTVMERDANGRPIYDKDGRPRYRTEVVSRTRVRVNRITALANDLALALAAPSIRIEAPVPGKPIIGIEVPNTSTTVVSLRSVIESTAFQRVAARSKLALALGKGVSGEPVAADLAKMPHLLIAGATGSGKSVCINSIIACLLMHNAPEDVRFVLIDPKRVELANFASIPHLAFSKIITDTEEVVGTLQAVLHEMDSRYRKFASIGVRNIEAYNKSPRAPMKLPYWVVVIDELADLMMAAPYQVERQVCRLAQLARATGIHLIIATQRPSVDVVTGLIKANFPTRIAFAVSSQVDSRTIIDSAGAEKLLGRGDMLFMPTDASKPRRIQGSFVSDQELDRIVGWWTNDRFRHLRPEPMDHLLAEASGEQVEGMSGEEDDPLLEAARELALQHSRISTSLLQRRLHIGYPRAARLIDLLEREGIVAPSEGSGQSRKVLRPEDDWERLE